MKEGCETDGWQTDSCSVMAVSRKPVKWCTLGKARRKTHRVRDDEGFLTFGHFLLSNSLMQQTHCITHTRARTHTRPLPNLAPPAAAPSSTRRHAAFRAGKHNAFESVGVGLCTCSRRSCYGSALLLERQSDWLVSRGLVWSALPPYQIDLWLFRGSLNAVVWFN